MEGFEERLAALKGDMRSERRSGSDGYMGDRRRTTWVFGGWDRDTEKGRILNELQQP